jgi:hypothetical protein
MTYNHDLIKDEVEMRVEYYEGTELYDFTKGDDVDEYISKVIDKCHKLYEIYCDIMNELFDTEDKKSTVNLTIDD